MLLRNLNQKRILFAENGIDRWNSANVARAIVRRIARQGTDTVTINHFDVMVINRMAQVLYVGGRFNNPFNGTLAIDCSQLEVPTRDILRIFQ